MTVDTLHKTVNRLTFVLRKMNAWSSYSIVAVRRVLRGAIVVAMSVSAMGATTQEPHLRYRQDKTAIPVPPQSFEFWIFRSTR